MNFLDENKKSWTETINKVFPNGIPERCEWIDRHSIVKILKIIGSIKNLNHMFFPRGGGLDVEGANISVEDECIEINTGGLIEIVKPSKLIFHSFNSDYEWFYFRLETKELKPTGIYDYENEEYSDEELCELNPGNYISRSHWDYGEYNDKKLPESARVVTRHFKGSFVIFQKTSIYNHNSSTYDGRHDKMTDDEFRSYIQEVINKLKSKNWNG